LGFSCKEDSLARWRLLEPDADVVSELAREVDVDLLCARVLANRGVAPGEAADFLSPSLAAVGMPGEDQWNVAAERVAKAIRGGERIGIFGDYDTDGITSAAVLFLALSHYTDNVTITSRRKTHPIRRSLCSTPSSGTLRTPWPGWGLPGSSPGP
jgi:hypothetical protein